MKNIHILPTDKPTRLHNTFNVIRLEKGYDLSPNNQNIYITNDEEIKEEDWFITKGEVFKCTLVNEFIWRNNFDKFPSIKIDCKKIILTTDQDLIKDGVQAIDDEFLEWFIKNSNCEKVEVVNEPYEAGNIYQPNHFDYYRIIIPKEQHLIDMENHKNSLWEESKKETLEEAENLVKSTTLYGSQEATIGSSARSYFETELRCVLLGIKYQQERSYSEEDMKLAFEAGYDRNTLESLDIPDSEQDYRNFKEWFEQFSKLKNG